MAISLAEECLPYGRIAKRIGFDFNWLDEYRRTYPLFDKRIKAARESGLEELAFSTMTIMDEYDNANHARVKVDSIKWYCAVMNPAVYGQKVDITMTQTIDIGAALDASNRRVMRDVAPLQIEQNEIW